MEITIQDCRVVNDKGEAITNLNFHLAKTQKITFEQLFKLKILHLKRHSVIEDMKGINTKGRLRSLAKEITNIDYELQENWNFKKDIYFHRFWDLPFCTCPKLDNEDRIGTPYVITTSGCPIHGDK